MKVTLIGDSIRQNYESSVRELLGEKYEVWAPGENCRFSKYTLRGLFDWSKGMEGSDIVHWNNGQWDICNLFGDAPFTSEQEYIDNMLRIADILLKRYKAIVFATTTPVRYGNGFNSNEVIERYNSIIVPKLQEKGIIINDIHSILKTDINRYISEDTIHLTPEGIELCAKQVANCIKEAASKLSKTEEKIDSKNVSDDLGAPVLI